MYRAASLPIAFAALGCLLATGAAWAQQTPPGTHIELTAFAGRQSGADFSDQTSGRELRLESADTAGLILDVNLAPDTQLEFLYSRANSSLRDDAGAHLIDVKMEYLHMGAAYVYNTGRLRPFMAVTLGATRMEPTASGFDGDTRFSLGIGGGVKFFPIENVGIRLEVRAYATQVDSDSAAFCNNGTCRIYYDGDFLMQYTANAGVVIAF